MKLPDFFQRHAGDGLPQFRIQNSARVHGVPFVNVGEEPQRNLPASNAQSSFFTPQLVETISLGRGKGEGGQPSQLSNLDATLPVHVHKSNNKKTAFSLANCISKRQRCRFASQN
jgi:hypothetical protein